jgi:hypothetical protein
MKTELMPVFGRHRALRWERAPSGELLTNVPHSVRHHSPDGFEIGYAGSGPADLALNALASLFPARRSRQCVECFDGRVSATAWRLHQQFKSDFLIRADRQRGEIAWERILAWLERHIFAGEERS